jgi:hypothetical protein
MCKVIIHVRLVTYNYRRNNLIDGKEVLSSNGPLTKLAFATYYHGTVEKLWSTHVKKTNGITHRYF